MQEYIITYSRRDVENQVMQVTKWAHDEKKALSYILKSKPIKDGFCNFKKGGSGRIISVQEVKE
tara:strand:- start:8901 stop:9092 length:192 start_codon:yes stop_codon:yes gene_type:complete